MRWLLGKDLRILGRSRLLVAILVIYPVAIALLIGLALSRSPGKPKVAIVDLTPPGQAIELGGRQLSVAQYVNELFREVDATRAPSRAAAAKEVSSGNVLAAVVIPGNVVSKISSGIRQAQVEVIYNGDALKQSFVRATIESALAEANLALSTQIKDVAVKDIDLLLEGGELGILGAPKQLVGLKQIPSDLRRIAAKQTSKADRAELERIAAFASFAAQNLGLSKSVLSTVSQPISVRQTLLQGRRTPLDAYAVVVAVTISLMFVCVLLAAGGVALEREDHALGRLVRGGRGGGLRLGRARGRRGHAHDAHGHARARHGNALLSLPELITEKVTLAAVCSFALSLAMLAAISAFVPLSWGRAPLWVASLALGALGFAALGVAIGALAREVRAATLLAFLLSLPLAFLALVPSGAVASGLYDVISVISFLFPYKAALQALDVAVNGGTPAIWLSALHLAVLGVVFAVLAGAGLRRPQ